MNIKVGDKIVCKIGEGRMVNAGDVCTITSIRGEVYTFVANKNGRTVTGWWHPKLYPDDFELYEFNMSDIEKAKQAVEAAEKQLVEAKLALEKAEKKNKIGLKIPEFGEKYYQIGGDDEFQLERGYEDNNLYIHTWSSTNQKQNKAFQEALCVMAEMRVQDGIVVPDGESEYYTISFDFSNGKLDIDIWSWTIGISLFPAFETETAAQTAINNVGTERVIQCIKTMMFMTPESRGEVNDHSR